MAVTLRNPDVDAGRRCVTNRLVAERSFCFSDDSISRNGSYEIVCCMFYDSI